MLELIYDLFKTYLSTPSKNEPATNPFVVLPDDIIGVILEHLTVIQWIALSRVDRRFHSIVLNPTLWYKLLKKLDWKVSQTAS
jgi:hypothetical protein